MSRAFSSATSFIALPFSPSVSNPSNLQLLFTLTFWLLVRQSVKQNFSRKNAALQEVTTGGWRSSSRTAAAAALSEFHLFPFLSLVYSNRSPPSEEAPRDESVLKVLGGMVMSSYAKYWIYVCGGMFIMVSFAGKLVGYKIVYMLLLLMCLCLYQVGPPQPPALAESRRPTCC